MTGRINCRISLEMLQKLFNFILKFYLYLPKEVRRKNDVKVEKTMSRFARKKLCQGLHEVMQSRVACIPIPCMQLSLLAGVLSDKSESRPIPAPEQNH